MTARLGITTSIPACVHTAAGNACLLPRASKISRRLSARRLSCVSLSRLSFTGRKSINGKSYSVISRGKIVGGHLRLGVRAVNPGSLSWNSRRPITENPWVEIFVDIYRAGFAEGTRDRAGWPVEKGTGNNRSRTTSEYFYPMERISPGETLFSAGP